MSLSEASPLSAESHPATTPRVHDCSHCGLPVPDPLWDESQAENFCCSGCETVFHLLRGAGLEEYYAFRNKLGEEGRKVVDVPSGGEAEFDSPAFRDVYCDKLPSGQMRTELLVEGVHCAACVWLIERLPRVDSAAVEARLDMARSSVTLTWDPEVAPLSRLAKTLTSMGYRPRPYRGQEAVRMRRDELRSLMIRMGVAGAVAGNVMLMAFALYSGEVGLHEAGTMSASTTRFFELLSLVVSLPALWAGGLFFRGAWSAVRTRTPHMDLPIAIGISVGFLWGTYGALSGAGEIYFDSITTLIFFLLIGRYLQRRHQMAAADAAELLHSVVPSVARAKIEADVHSVTTADISPGTLVVVESGEVLPVDGVVTDGSSVLDKSLLSGESVPVSVSQGEQVEAGALNLGSQLIVQAARAGGETRIAQLMRDVEKALGRRTRLVGQADRIAGIFTMVVLGLAVVVAMAWSFHSGKMAIERSLALLIVACPCALGLATPLALNAAVSQAARTKKLVFSPEALEQLARPVELVLDKTGTLTQGVMGVIAWEGDSTVVSLVAEVESHSNHPVARALREYGEGAGPCDIRLVGPVNEELGGGLRVETSAGLLHVGSTRFVLAAAELSPELRRKLDEDRLAAPVLVALDGRVVAIAWLGDELREDAALSLVQLYRAGHHLHLLSGDHEATVVRVAQQLTDEAGIPGLFTSVRGEVSPEDKLRRISELQESPRPVVMVGDGVNDAGALARADVGVAVKGAAEASRLSADVYLAAPGVHELAHLFRGSRRVLQAVRRGIGFSLGYNAVGITCAAMGVIGPLGAAVLMPLSSLTVVTNAYKSPTFTKDRAS